VNQAPNPALYNDLEWRGLVKQVTDPGLSAVLAKTPLTLYAGFDPTADSLHLGSLLPILTLKRFQMAGHKVIAVAGGATGRIGDPSGKTAERTLLTDEILAKNLKGIRRDLSRFLDFSGSNAALLVDNADWFKGMSYLDFLRDVGKHFTVNLMMGKESVRARLEDREHGISYTEFSYMLVQAYDFFVLNRDHGCRLQIGGSDQWGNITAGCELIRRVHAGHESARKGEKHNEVFGLTFPLVTKKDGGKFGKSESGNVWLDPAKTPAYDFYQFLLQTADDDVIQYLKFFSFYTRAEIEALEKSLKGHPEERQAQKALASELTRLVHGEAALEQVEKQTAAFFGADLKSLSREDMLRSFKVEPVKLQGLGIGSALIDVLVACGLCASKGAARKEIQGGGVYINDERVSDVTLVLTPAHLLPKSGIIMLRRGKKNHCPIEISG
jgi:tyrosyl-tRNA synthetase